MAQLEIVYLSPHDLKPYEGNTRKHAPDDIDQIKASIEADGFNDPIGIWGEENLIVEGHGRQIAALEMGLEKVPCIRLDHMTDTQRRDYAIRHNRTAELSGWDFGKLEEEIARLEIEGIDLSGLKFTFGGDFGSDDEYLKEQTEPEAKQGKTCTCPSCGFTFETL
jgi:ParB-like chromosome segregation protein Spo0J